ncbi:MAG: helix-hairpin-helix domain-containing protein [Patescibacteria group bacterium]
MTNLEIAELLRDMAAAYQLQDDRKNRFKIIAYQRAADAVEHASSELKDLWDDGKLKEVPGIGESIADHLSELFETGKSKHFIEVMKDLPPFMFELMKIPGVGVKTAYKLVSELGIKSFTDLKKAIKSGAIAKLSGFGEESQAAIFKSFLDFEKKPPARHLLPYASEVADGVITWLKENKNVVKVDPLGSLRRRAATIGDIDISVASTKPDDVVKHFVAYPKATRVLEKGTRSASLILPGNIQVDLMVTDPSGYGSLLQHFTGSKHHNIALRERALKMGLSVSDYGIKKNKSKNNKLELFSNEEDFYKRLGLEYIPPEIREDAGEIEAAVNHKLPKLIELSDVKSDLQIHSSFDIETSHDLGESSMEKIIDRAGELGYQYIAFTEHNPSKSKHNEKQIIDILKSKREKIDQLNYSISKNKKNSVKKVFNSLEIDILTEGGLPVPDAGMETLDFALVSIHSSFRLPREEMTKRILSALIHPKVQVFAHPTARKINDREGVELNWPEIFDFCLKHNKWVEINCDPARLDLPDVLVKEAVKTGVILTFGTDAHHMDGMYNMEFGVNVARRGWCEKKNVVNCLNLIEFEKMLGGENKK